MNCVGPDAGFSLEIPRREAMRKVTAALRAAGVQEAGLDARLLLCAAAGIDHLDLVRDPETVLEEEAAIKLGDFLRRRLNREPVSRILGQKGFWSLELLVTPDVLDPRPDSEILVETALELFSERQDNAFRIADLGVGSGALLCALLDVFPSAVGVAVDLSDSACSVARKNLAACGFEGRFSVLHGDWRIVADRKQFDLVVSNPPYIPTRDITNLDPEVKNFDPWLALDGGDDGLRAYREIASLLPGVLAPGGVAILELGHDQAEAVADIVRRSGLRAQGVRRDLGGKTRAIVVCRT